MKRTFLPLAYALLILWTGTARAQTFTPDITQTVGTGANVSYFVINFEDGPNGADNPASDYVFAYRWDYGGGNTAPTGGDTIDTLAAQASPPFIVTFDPNYDTKPNRYVSTYGYGGHSDTAYSNPDQSYGYWAYWTSTGDRLSHNSQDWDYSDVGLDQRPLAPNSFDGWTFATDQATPTPVTPTAAPEQGTALPLTLGAGGVFLLGLRARRRA